MKNLHAYILGVGLIPALFSCQLAKPIIKKEYKETWQQTQLPAEKPVYTIFALGDAGDPDTSKMDGNFQTLNKRLREADENALLIFCGDNVYPKGLPHSSDPKRRDFEKHLDSQIAIADGFKGRTIFIPGNHDWDHEKRDGYIKAREQEKYIEEKMQNSEVFFPADACPGPEEVHLTDNIVLITLNTQWWLHKYAKPDTGICEFGTDLLFLNEFENALKRNADKQIIVTAHHPMESQGPHGGKFPVTAHFFPLREFNRNLWVPLPVLGSFYVLFRVSGYRQDVTHKRYKELQTRLESVMEQYPNTIYLNGHDHSIQYIPKNGVHYITSGAGTEVSHVVKAKRLHFGYAGKGHTEIKIYSDNTIWVEFIRTLKNGQEEVMYRTQIKK